MKRAEKEADLYRNLLMLALTSLLGIIAFMFVNIETMSVLKILILICAIAVNVAFVIVFFSLIVKNFKKLEELQ